MKKTKYIIVLIILIAFSALLTITIQGFDKHYKQKQKYKQTIKEMEIKIHKMDSIFVIEQQKHQADTIRILNEIRKQKNIWKLKSRNYETKINNAGAIAPDSARSILSKRYRLE